MFNFIKSMFANEGIENRTVSDAMESYAISTQPIVNPATGEIMLGGISGLDTSGNPYGFDLSMATSLNIDKHNNNWNQNSVGAEMANIDSIGNHVEPFNNQLSW